MIQFSVFGIRTSIQWHFWILCLFVGRGLDASTRQEMILLLIVSVVIFLSIMVHELGHALVGRHFGAFPSIGLHGMGGVTHLPGATFTRLQHIAVIAAGPLAGLALAAVCLMAARLDIGISFVDSFFEVGVFVNVVWTIFNMLPIQPMDGGQILREVLGPRHFKLTCIIGCVCAVVMAVVAFRSGFVFASLFLAYFAFLNFRGHALEGGVMTR